MKEVKERPTIFTPYSVQKILAGSKTQTRRVLKTKETQAIKGTWLPLHCPKCSKPHHDEGVWQKKAHRTHLCFFCRHQWKPAPFPTFGTGKVCPYGTVGDRLWVKEKYTPPEDGDSSVGEDALPLSYAADRKDWESCDWNTPLFMPKKYARLWLELRHIRLERLQQITQEDAAKELGLTLKTLPNGENVWDGLPGTPSTTRNPKKHFQAAWDNLHQKRGYSFAKNPWVWVLSFQQIEPVSEETKLAEQTELPF